MNKKEKIINEGGINGTGEGVVNINSKDYKGLQKAVQEHYKKREKKDIIRTKLISIRLQMKTYVSTSSPSEIKTSGFFLKKFIKSIGIKNKEFANFINIEEPNLSAILNGKRRINTDLALILGLVFNINPNIWLQIQIKNDLILIQKQAPKDSKRYSIENLLKKVS